MSITQPFITTLKGRPFAASAIALQAVIVNDQEQILLLNSPIRNQGWQTVSGGLEAGETLLEGVRREVAEEVGPDVRVRPLGVVHAQTFHYDDNVQFMVGIYYLLAYEGGKIVPGDDMAGSTCRWWSLEELEDKSQHWHPTVIPWMLHRAIDLYRLWQDDPERPLQPKL
ncbi:MAG: NUDIX hydrolase [Ardenticatenaceae bacterium]|nr:NUDIX hydrolase [Ardenticatenaceae bacterium]MCB9446208.1 NUDIX hydrolase [Ardenticatenaceae bacterium]